MKNFKYNLLSSFCIVALIMISLLSSCNADDSVNTTVPSITSVSKTAVYPANGTTPEKVVDSLTTQGFAGESFIIRGSGFTGITKIYFNDFDTYFNPTLVTDNIIFVTINRQTPYSNVSNKLKIVNDKGTATYDFIVAPPAPVIESYNAINAVAGDIITIYGTFFLNPVVKFDDIPATVVSSTLTEIKVTVPAGANNKYVYVTTISGSAKSREAVGSAFFDDAFYSLSTATSGLWSASTDTWDYNYTTDYSQGKVAMKCILGGWNGLDIRRSGDLDLTPYKALRIAVKGKSVGSLKYLINGNWGITPTLPVTTDWVTIEIPFTDLGNPTIFNAITFQESGNTGGNTVYIDNIGFVLK